MKPKVLSANWRSWAGLVLSPLAWAGHHQLGSYLEFARCQSAGMGPIAVSGLVALAVIALGALLSFRAWRAAGGAVDRREVVSGRFISALSLMAAGLFTLAVCFHILASVLLPACFR